MAAPSSPVGIRDHLQKLTYNMVTRMILGKRYYGVAAAAGAQFIRLMEEITQFGLAGCLADFFPWLQWLDWKLQQSWKVHLEMDKLLQGILDEHRKVQDGRSVDLLDMMLSSSKFRNDEHIKAMVLDLLLGGTATSASTVEWALAELLTHPRALIKAQEEIDAVIEKGRAVTEADTQRMPFLQAIVKETFRLHPPVPLLLPHCSSQDCKISGYDIPSGTTAFVNVYAIGRDATIWDDPLEFKPERFLDERHKDVDPRHGRYFELLAFGSGRRACPGAAMGLSTVHLLLATLLHCFEWKAQDSIDLTERQGVTNSMYSPLETFPTARFRLQDLYHCDENVM